MDLPPIQSCPNCASHIVGNVGYAEKGNHSQPQSGHHIEILNECHGSKDIKPDILQSRSGTTPKLSIQWDGISEDLACPSTKISRCPKSRIIHPYGIKLQAPGNAFSRSILGHLYIVLANLSKISSVVTSHPL